MSVCGLADESQDVETYDGSLGVTRQFVDDHESPVGQRQWLDDLEPPFNGPYDEQGDVSAERWATGALIRDNLFLTAGHCFDQSGKRWQRPTRKGTVIFPGEIATLMRVNFKYQLNGQTGQMRPGDPFPVVRLLEYRVGGIDYAIVKLGPNAAGRLPNDVYGALRIAATDLTTSNARLCVIQHSNRREKRVAAGTMLANRAGIIRYNNIDTGAGSSGAPVLDENGQIVGVHQKGGCSTLGGANRGLSIGVIRAASKLISE